jgi:hypothetical protein
LAHNHPKYFSFVLHLPNTLAQSSHSTYLTDSHQQALRGFALSAPHSFCSFFLHADYAPKVNGQKTNLSLQQALASQLHS